MKKITLPLLMSLSWSFAVFAAEPETPAFPGLQKVMTPEQYVAFIRNAWALIGLQGEKGTK